MFSLPKILGLWSSTLIPPNAHVVFGLDRGLLPPSTRGFVIADRKKYER